MEHGKLSYDICSSLSSFSEAARKRGFWLFWCSVWGSCYKESSGCVVVVVGEPVSDSS